MAVTKWIDNDTGYLAWTERHPDRFVANVTKSMRPLYFKVHRADHRLPDRSAANTKNPWTGNLYRKITADSLEELWAWGKASGFSLSPQNFCQHCCSDLSPPRDFGAPTGEVARDPYLPPEEILEGSTFFEGAVDRILVNRYERDPKAREACIAHYGVACTLCGFHFGLFYGEITRDFIHVHHLKLLACVGADYRVDPIKDMRPLCPNCHAVVHRREPPYSPDEVRRSVQMHGHKAKQI